MSEFHDSKTNAGETDRNPDCDLGTEPEPVAVDCREYRDKSKWSLYVSEFFKLTEIMQI